MDGPLGYRAIPCPYAPAHSRGALLDCALWVRGLMYHMAIAADGKIHKGATDCLWLAVNDGQESPRRP